MVRAWKHVLWVMLVLPLALALPTPASAESYGLGYFNREFAAETHRASYWAPDVLDLQAAPFSANFSLTSELLTSDFSGLISGNRQQLPIETTFALACRHEPCSAHSNSDQHPADGLTFLPATNGINLGIDWRPFPGSGVTPGHGGSAGLAAYDNSTAGPGERHGVATGSVGSGVNNPLAGKFPIPITFGEGPSGRNHPTPPASTTLGGDPSTGGYPSLPTTIPPGGNPGNHHHGEQPPGLLNGTGGGNPHTGSHVGSPPTSGTGSTSGTSLSPSPVATAPEPSTLWLLSSGAFGLLAFGWASGRLRSRRSH